MGAVATAKRVLLSQGRQWIKIDNLAWLPDLQPRDGINKDWARDLSGYRKEGSEFPPIRVYQLPDGRLTPAEGHHRSQAMKDAGEDDILCDVKNGAMEDAVEFAAGSNRTNGVKPMSAKENRRAIEMLLMLEKWQAMSHAAIAEYVTGNAKSSGTVKSVRSRLVAEGKIPDCPRITTRSGRNRTAKPARRNSNERSIHTSGRGYSARVCGKHVRGRTPDEVQNKIDAILSDRETKRTSVSYDYIYNILMTNGFASVFSSGTRSRWKCSISAWFRGQLICTQCDFEAGSFAIAIASLVIARQKIEGDGATGQSLRTVILCYVEDGPADLIELAKRAGFEFMTPDELVASLDDTPADPKGPTP